MAPNNPWHQSMVRMKAPPGCGAVTVDGFELEFDDDSCVVVPQNKVAELQAHGFTRAPAAAEAEQPASGRGRRATA